MPAAAWAARSGDPVLFAAAEQAARSRPPSALKRHPRRPVYVLGPSSAISSSGGPRNRQDRQPRCAASPARTRSRTRSPSPATPTAASAGTSTTPATASSSPAATTPLDAAAAAPLSASGTWGPLLLTDSADTLPAALREYLLDVKPGYTTDPTRAFYNHVWVIGDQEAIDVNQQAEIDELAELAKIGGGEP